MRVDLSDRLQPAKLVASSWISYERNDSVEELSSSLVVLEQGKLHSH
jgi:hypothetical protein